MDSDEILKRHVADTAPTGDIVPPATGKAVTLPREVTKHLPIRGAIEISAHQYGHSLWGDVIKVEAQTADRGLECCLLKTVTLGSQGEHMVRGEFESLKALHALSPTLVPKPYAQGSYEEVDDVVYFLLEEFREIGQQPPEPERFAAKLAELHRRSISPTGKFGFHMTTYLASTPQLTDLWHESWSVVFQKQLDFLFAQDRQHNLVPPEFTALSDVLISAVVPRLLEPLQYGDRNIEPCLVHGDLWDENTATDKNTGEPFIFDPGSFYAHNEYELGNWRAVRHRLSRPEYVETYKKNFPPSEPAHEWGSRNQLYSIWKWWN